MLPLTLSGFVHFRSGPLTAAACDGKQPESCFPGTEKEKPGRNIMILPGICIIIHLIHPEKNAQNEEDVIRPDTVQKQEKIKMRAENRTSSFRRVIGDILLALVILLLADVLFVMPAKISSVVLKADYRKVFMYELMLCAILLLFSLDVRFSLFSRWKPAILRGTGWALRAVIALLSAVILFFCGKVITGGFINTAGQAEYAIVLGLALENGEPVPDLTARLDTARAYLEKYPEAQLILTGGNADKTGRTEAAVMRDILTEKGVPEDRLILEDQAETTKENFQNIAGMLRADEPVVMISSNYHMDRAVRNAGEAGFTHVLRYPAPSGFFAYGANMLSEVVLDLNDLTK